MSNTESYRQESEIDSAPVGRGGVDDLDRLTGVLVSRWCAVALPIAALTSMILSLWFVFCVAPSEAVKGPVQRIFYFHVASALTCYVAITAAFVAGVLYLVYRSSLWDLLGEAFSSVALLLCSIVLASGMIWGHSAWNTWWRWEPRLVSFLILWLIVFGGVILRSSHAADDRRAVISAVFSIVSALNIPIVIFSVKFLARTEQLHPQVVGNQGLTDPGYVWALGLATAATFLVSMWLVSVKLGNIVLREEILHWQRQKNHRELS